MATVQRVKLILSWANIQVKWHSTEGVRPLKSRSSGILNELCGNTSFWNVLVTPIQILTLFNTNMSLHRHIKCSQIFSGDYNMFPLTMHVPEWLNCGIVPPMWGSMRSITGLPGLNKNYISVSQYCGNRTTSKIDPIVSKHPGKMTLHWRCAAVEK